MSAEFLYSLSHLKLDSNTTKNELLHMLKKHDNDSYIFSFYTGAFNYAITKEMNRFTPEDEFLFFQCGLFHDIGKLGMKPEFINYPGQYTMNMYNEMKKHALGGLEILSNLNNIEEEIMQTSGYHHCNYDGTGYPGGLEGKEIPFPARLTRVSDSLDAYLTKRCYKEGGPAREAFEDLNGYKGQSYDPEIINAFEKVHFNVIEKCHKFGEDRPSRKMYTEFLVDLYLYDLEYKNPQDVLEKL